MRDPVLAARFAAVLNPAGVWLGASRALGRTVPAGEPYPHICGITITDRIGEQLVLWRRDCAACQAGTRKGV